MTITLIQGTPGSGKSAVMVSDMIGHLMSGGIVACNFNLIDGWSQRIADNHFRCKLGLRDRFEMAKSLWERAYKVGTSDTIFELSKILNKRQNGRLIEGQGRLYIDEAQLLFNSRDWKKNMPFIEFFTQHRKLGWDVYLIAHSIDMIDAQIRPLIEIEGRFRNWKKVKIFGTIPLSPVHLFFSVYRYAGVSAGSGSIAYRRWYLLDKAWGSSYDSTEVFAFNQASLSVTHHGEKPYSDYGYGPVPLLSSFSGPRVRSDLHNPYRFCPLGTVREMI